MPNKKLTDSEIVKALRSWLEEIRKSRQAYLEKVNEEHYPSMRYEYLLSDTIHEINRLQAENERLKEKDETRHKVYMTKCEELEAAKAEAYKECIDMVKKKGVKVGVDEICIFTNTLDNILKKLVGE